MFIYENVLCISRVLSMNNVQISVKLPERQRKKIEELIESGVYSSVSEFIREAVRKLLKEYGGE